MDATHTYQWDADGHPVNIDGVGLTYDALGGMVEQARGTAYQQIVYAPSGAKLAIMKPERQHLNGGTGIKDLPMGMIQPTRLKLLRGINTAKMAATRRNSLFLALVCSLIWLVSCSPCRDTVRTKVKSADGQLVANGYERDCGATTDFSSIVNVQSASDKFHADEGLLLIVKGRHELSLAWTGPRTLLITCTSCPRKNVYREVVALGDIDVKYELGPGQ